MIADETLKLSEEEIAPLLSLGPASAMANDRPGQRPEDLLPNAQTLVCFGLPASIENWTLKNVRASAGHSRDCDAIAT